MAIKLSKSGKMPCKSWSLEALVTCPGARENGELVPACAGCYATSGNYRFPNVKAPRASNLIDWKRDAWVDDMVAAIGTDKYFRFFDSGDVYHIDLARKILAVMRATPNTRHWLPTRMHKIAKFKAVLLAMAKLDNVVVRRSSDAVTGQWDKRQSTASTIYVVAHGVPAGATGCPAYTTDGKCGDCRQCWDKNISCIAYPGHGRTMVKLQNDIIARGV